jgi:anti-sigma regulatory factor (Ser/Thr protein kinase)
MPVRSRARDGDRRAPLRVGAGLDFAAVLAARHGRVPGRDFHLRLSLTPAGTDAAATVRVEVTDTRTEKLPALTPPTGPDPEDSGRGLLLVSQLADDWGWYPRPDAPGKTVWAQ